MVEKMNVHVVTHTHWDREWYAPFEVFKGRLLELIDNLIEEMDNYPHFKHFMLDGQTVVLEDYLEERPQNKEKLVKLIRQGKIIVGPWYILPDEFLVTGEAMIRNFLIGQHVLESLNVPSMKIGYLPDMFGHNAYTPTILKDLGLKAAVVWRGVGDACRDTEFMWKSPNGDEMPTVSLLHGYGNGAHFGRSVSEMKDVFLKEIKFLSKHKTTNNILIMNGTDHEFPLYDLPKEFSNWQEEVKASIVHSTIEEYVNSMINEKPDLKAVYGELKDPKYEHTLKDITSTRIYLKTLNFDAQQLFIRYVEPLSALLFLNGEKVEPKEIENGWKLILKSQPHDSICGCSVDSVHRDVESRLRNSIEVGASLTAKYMRKISKGMEINVDLGIPLLVFNPYEHERISVVSTVIKAKDGADYEVFDENGEKCAAFMKPFASENEKMKVLSEMRNNDYLKFLTNLSDFQNVLAPSKAFYEAKTLTFQTNLPPLGFKMFYLKEKKTAKTEKREARNTEYENEFYVFHLNENGSFDLKDKTNGALYKALNYFEDIADAGDEYNFSPIDDDKPITNLNVKANVISVEEHEFLKKITVESNMELPKSLDKSRKTRTNEKTTVKIKITYTLYRNIPRIDVDLSLKNTASDHKLSFVVNIPEKLEEVKNDGYFGLVSHPVDMKIYDDSYAEEDISRYAMESFALFKGEKPKLLVTTRGIHEYESHLVKNETKVNFTILRSVGWLSRGDISVRKGNAGPELPTPEAQCIGEYNFRYSFAFIKEGSETEAYKTAKDFLLEPTAIMTYESREKADISVPNFKFDDNVFLSAFKISQDEKTVVMRWTNHSDNESKVRIESPFALRIEDSNTAEDPSKKGTSNEIITIEARKIKTVRFLSLYCLD